MTERPVKESEEKTTEWEDLRRNDLIDTLAWAGAFVWGGLVLLLETTGYGANFDWWSGWAVFFVGSGVGVLLLTLVRLMMPQFRRKIAAGSIFGFILLGIGLGELTSVALIWPLGLIAIGVVILLSLLSRRARPSG